MLVKLMGTAVDRGFFALVLGRLGAAEEGGAGRDFLGIVGAARDGGGGAGIGGRARGNPEGAARVDELDELDDEGPRPLLCLRVADFTGPLRDCWAALVTVFVSAGGFNDHCGMIGFTTTSRIAILNALLICTHE